VIQLKNISKKFVSGKSATNALFDINLNIQEGQFIALMGPSGSGKSTLLNLIGGLDTPSEGSILIEGKDISEYSDKELSRYRNHTVGFVFQEFHLESFLSVKNNVLLPTYFNHTGKHDEIYAEKLIKEVELSNKIDSKINELSGGQKQRTAIARALINKPKIILADEPTGNLDLKTGQTIIDLLKKLQKAHNITLIIATHDPLVAKAAGKIIEICDGHLA
jgi:putative ABC transport system ATP-binding protein